jgi:hypothetical protein
MKSLPSEKATMLMLNKESFLVIGKQIASHCKSKHSSSLTIVRDLYTRKVNYGSV